MPTVARGKAAAALLGVAPVLCFSVSLFLTAVDPYRPPRSHTAPHAALPAGGLTGTRPYQHAARQPSVPYDTPTGVQYPGSPARHP